MSPFQEFVSDVFERSVERQRANAYAPPEPDVLSASAIRYAQERVVSDSELVSEFFVECDDDRHPCSYFGPIRTTELWEVLMSPDAKPEQVVAARDEFRKRLLEHFDKQVLEMAEKVSHA